MKGPKINIFKKRFFKIEGHNLIYQTDSKDCKALGSIDLRTALTDIAPEKSSNKRKYVFRVEIPGRTYFMSAPSKLEWRRKCYGLVLSLSNLLIYMKNCKAVIVNFKIFRIPMIFY
ncbi:predicted protein [Naegleria gruberi]|uniref:Predicted protein n=1 Tax=Naegleria gruberi TaxID=5762 RepID=D2VJR6_NAEGR|nr:uncharacterized protein NAEGRDRAFT_69136 [Naegleria gruberi]EFC42997.1 predicted protein [Naegleria gruberi]|eukprot:XP_002675741.1 predicted protein [Naegleria gruberi strain NEG-M]